MDNWSSDQLKKMQLGGNKKAREFFQSQPGYRNDMGIKAKYSGEAASIYREKLAAEADGRKYLGPSSARMDAIPSPSTSPFSNSSVSSGGSNTGGPLLSGSTSRSAASRNSNVQDFFSKKQAENSSKPDSLPPSQGGRYSGFGNSAYAHSTASSSRQSNDVMGMLSSGFSTLSGYLEEGVQMAVAGASKFNEAVILPAATAVKDGTAKEKILNLFQPNETQHRTTVYSAPSDSECQASSSVDRSTMRPTSSPISHTSSPISRTSSRSGKAPQKSFNDDKWDSWD